MILLLQLICVTLLSLATGLYRMDVLAFKSFAAIFGFALLVTLVLGLVAFGQIFLAWRQAATVSASLWLAVVIALFTWLVFITVIVKASAYPLIHHISTDTSEPPVFSNAVMLRSASDNTLTYSDDVEKIQKVAYPHIQTLSLSLTPEELFPLALAVAEEMTWTLEYTNKDENRFEATERSAVFGFVDDIAVRIESSAQGSKIDLRSVSRVGRGDFGANAKRIATFLTRLEEKVNIH